MLYFELLINAQIFSILISPESELSSAILGLKPRYVIVKSSGRNKE